MSCDSLVFSSLGESSHHRPCAVLSVLSLTLLISFFGWWLMNSECIGVDIISLRTHQFLWYYHGTRSSSPSRPRTAVYWRISVCHLQLSHSNLHCSYRHLVTSGRHHHSDSPLKYWSDVWETFVSNTLPLALVLQSNITNYWWWNHVRITKTKIGSIV